MQETKMGSMVTTNYYPETSQGRAEWWENILLHGAPLLATAGLEQSKIDGIMADAAWAVYSYGTLPQVVDRSLAEVSEYASAVAVGTCEAAGEKLPAPPQSPEWPAPPSEPIKPDLEHRRVEWVQEVKSLPGFSQEIGEALGLLPLPTVFNGGSYKADLHDLISTEPKTISGKFRKAHGNVEGIVLRGRRKGSASWVELGRFKATPFSALVPVAGSDPEDWQFQARALKRDIETGIGSDILDATVAP
jgi:hypothetical protein